MHRCGQATLMEGKKAPGEKVRCAQGRCVWAPVRRWWQLRHEGLGGTGAQNGTCRRRQDTEYGDVSMMSEWFEGSSGRVSPLKEVEGGSEPMLRNEIETGTGRRGWRRLWVRPRASVGTAAGQAQKGDLQSGSQGWREQDGRGMWKEAHRRLDSSSLDLNISTCSSHTQYLQFPSSSYF